MNSHIRQLHAGVSVAILVTLGACSKDRNVGTTRVTSALPISDKVVTLIADARCEREATCDNIGKGKTYTNHQACVSDKLGEGYSHLTAAPCPIDEDSIPLRKCLADIRGEICGHPLDTVTRIDSCRAESLCPT